MKRIKYFTVYFVLALTIFSKVCYADSVEVNLDEGVFDIKAQFSADASTKTALEVLKDYDNIEKIISNIAYSKILPNRGDNIYVEQQGVYRLLKILPLKANVLLKIKEMSKNRITFEDIKKEDFKIYTGSWTVKSVDNKTSINYWLKVDPDFINIGALTRKIFGSMSESMMKDMKKEMARREQKRELNNGRKTYDKED